MGLNDTPSGERVHIGFFGKRNAGKSSLVNAVTGQDMAVVSETKGTTTDPVRKAMELLPIGPVMIIDTPGYDDEGALGEKRVQKTKQILNRTDVAVLVVDGTEGLAECDRELIGIFEEKEIPYLVVYNKADLLGPVSAGGRAEEPQDRTAAAAPQDQAAAMASSDQAAATVPPDRTVYVSALRGEGVRELLDAIVDLLPPPRGDCEGAPSGVVFDVEDDAALGRAALVRLFSGTLRNRESVRVRIGARREERKITQIRSIALSGKGADLGELRAGEIGRVFGLAGAGVDSALGAAEPPRLGNLREPLMMARLGAENADDHALMAALERLQAENPLLDAALYGGAPHVRLMGAMQLDVLAEDLRERFGIQAQFGPTSWATRRCSCCRTLRHPGAVWAAQHRVSRNHPRKRHGLCGLHHAQTLLGGDRAAH